MRQVFLTYDDDSHGKYRDMLLASVAKYGSQFERRVFHKSELNPIFVEQQKAILSLPRGGGYWLWKPYIIQQTLDTMADGDILFYLDSRNVFLCDFTELYAPVLTGDTDILVWKNKPNETTWYMRNWCKMDVIQKYGVYSQVFEQNAPDCWAGAIVLRKTAATVAMIDEWLRMCTCAEDITDSPSHLFPNSTEFHEHRHDQSLLSIVLLKHNVSLRWFPPMYMLHVLRY